jgi:hypothetical protein
LRLKGIIKTGVYSLSFAAIMLSVSDICSQDIQKKATKQSALESFSKGEFEPALVQFTELSNLYSRDPVYKYYMGSCLVNLKREPVRAADLLNNAIQSSAVIKTVPSDSWFYLGRARQMSGNFNGAIDAFNIYTEQAGKKNARSLGVSDFIQQCSEKKGMIAVAAPPGTEQVKSEGISIPAKVTVPIEAKNDDIPEVKNEQLIEAVPTDYDNTLNKALVSQFKADSITGIADSLRKQMNTLSWDKRIALQKRITGLDSLASIFQKMADNQYLGAEQNISEAKPEVENTGVENVIISEKDDTSGVVPKAVKQQDNQLADQPVTISIGITPDASVFSVFEVNKQKNSVVKAIPVNESFPAGLVYLIQLAVFRNPVSIEYFKGLGPVNGLRPEGSDKTNYYVGMFRRAEDAYRALTEVKKTGFNDAFVIAMVNNKPVSADRARILEKEWGQRPLLAALKESIAGSSVATKDTVPSSLLFRVEVMKSLKQVKPEVLESIKKLAGDRGLDTFTDKNGVHIFLIGKFLNFEAASEYTDLLKRNGYKEARVTAYIGKIEIPVEMALKLFEK